MRTPIFIALLVSTALPATAAELSPRCAAKQADIEANISAATARGNTRELAGLNKALRATKANCTEESLKEEKEARVRKAKQEIAKRERDLAMAEQKGDTKKLEKRRKKLEEARRELAAAEESR
jgi:hypothetical protein